MICVYDVCKYGWFLVVEEKLPQPVARLDRTGSRLFLMMAGEIGFLGDGHEMIMMVMMMFTSSMSWSVRSGYMQPSPTSLQSNQPSKQSPDIDTGIDIGLLNLFDLTTRAKSDPPHWGVQREGDRKNLWLHFQHSHKQFLLIL